MAQRMFILKTNPFVENEKEAFRYRRLNKYVKTKRDIDQMVNMNVQRFYSKGLLIEKGDYVTCCHIEDSINPDETFESHREGGWKLGKVLQAYSVQDEDNYYVIFPAMGSGVYASGVRLSTKEEIENFKKSKNG